MAKKRADPLDAVFNLSCPKCEGLIPFSIRSVMEGHGLPPVCANCGEPYDHVRANANFKALAEEYSARLTAGLAKARAATKKNK